tara:strand:- start:968 stop:1561 length:594 start_codon:yes stop_codon:yes gene_type:complete
MLTDTKYYDIENIESNGKVVKQQIMLGHTSRKIKDYKKSLKLRHNGNYEKLPHFIISKTGIVEEILPLDKPTKFFGHPYIDNNCIFILLENEGWLKKSKTQNRLCDWLGNIYKGEIVERKWRGNLFWATYTEKEVNSLCELLNKITDKFSIPKEFIGHNVKVDGVEKFKGIVCRSNYSDYYTDLSPAFNFEKITKIL